MRLDNSGGERSSSGSDSSSGYCGSQDLLLARAEVHQEPREASLPRRPSSSLSSFAPNVLQSNSSPPLRPEPSLNCDEAPSVDQSRSSGGTVSKILPLHILQRSYYEDSSHRDPPSFVDNYIERISAAQQVLRAFPPTAQSQVENDKTQFSIKIKNCPGCDCADQVSATNAVALK